jgi:hypothetical protein
MQGRCTECGLDFAWADVLNPMRGRLPGLVEHSRGTRQLLRWTLTTFWWIILPNRFWARVKMHHAVHPRRILPGPLLLALIVQFAVGTLGVITAIRLQPSTNTPAFRLNNIGEWWPNALSPYTEPLVAVTAYMMRNSVAIWIDWQILQWIDRFLGLTACILAWPLLFLVLPATRRAGGLRWVHVWRAGLYPLWWLFALLILDRVAAAGNSVILLIGGAGYNSWTYEVSRRFFLFYSTLSNILWIAAPVWIAAWWYSAISRGWQLHRARTLWLVLTVASALATALIFLFGWYMGILLTYLRSR